MNVIYAGDLHGRLQHFKELEETSSDLIIQVGDFGVSFGDTCKVKDWMEAKPEDSAEWITCGGNHDNWPKWRTMPQVQKSGLITGQLYQIAPNCFFAERNTVIRINGKLHLFFGGAESIDKYNRVEGVSWFPEETPTRKEFEGFMDALEYYEPEIVVTHDAPMCVNVPKIQRISNPTPQSLGRIFELSEHKPSKWYFGHHHIMNKWNIEHTEFICCGYHGEYVQF